MKRLLLFLLLLSLLTPACNREQAGTRETPPSDAGKQTETSPPAPHRLLAEALTPSITEVPAQALAAWSGYRQTRPALVLLSQDPLLQPFPAELREEVLALLKNGAPEEIAARTVPGSPTPLLLPSMALTAALEAGFFSRVVWVIPAKTEADKLDLETFRRQLRDIGAIDEQEAATFAAQGAGTFAGTVRGVPFLAVHPDALPELDTPIILHIDLTFFQPLYKGEVKSPLYSLLGQTLGHLREKQWQAMAVTLSLSNISGGVPLASRFVGNDLAAFFQNPEQLDAPPSAQMKRRADALYLENFFKKEEVRELYRQMETEAPADPSVKYALYDVSRQFKEGDQAMTYLQQAIELDRGYVLEYLTLAELAREKELPDQVLRMLGMAHSSSPDNPFIAMAMAEQLVALGHQEEAGKLLAKLQGLKWSTVYYPEVPGYLGELAQEPVTAH